MSVKRRPLERRPTNPGEYIREIYDGMKISQEKFAELLGVTRLTVSELVNTLPDGRPRRAITASTALRLERVTRISAPTWMNLQRAIDLFDAEKELGPVLAKLKPCRPARRFTKMPADLKEVR